MTVRKMLVFICMAVCIYAVYGSSGNNFQIGLIFPTAKDLPECQLDQMMICLAPAMAFVMTPEGRHLEMFGRTSTSLSQIIPENVFNSVCSIAQNVVPCVAEWINKCMPPEVLTKNPVMFRAPGKILSFCNETDSYSQFTKTANCGEKTSIPAQICANTVVQIAEPQIRAEILAHIDNRSAVLAEWDTNPTNFIWKRMNLQKHVCCNGEKIKECLAPVLDSGCTPEEKSLTENFIDRILTALECTEALYRC